MNCTKCDGPMTLLFTYSCDRCDYGMSNKPAAIGRIKLRLKTKCGIFGIAGETYPGACPFWTRASAYLTSQGHTGSPFSMALLAQVNGRREWRIACHGEITDILGESLPELSDIEIVGKV